MDRHPLGAFIIVDKELDRRLQAVRQLEIPTVQILAPNKERDPHALSKKFSEAGVEITVVFCGFKGESYADIPTVRRTVGLVPAETQIERLKEAKQISNFAKSLNVPATALHIGFIPEDRKNRDYKNIVAVAQDLADFCASNGQGLHLETGQETADGLLNFIEDVGRANIAVNFDPANMILYGSGEPLPALKMVGQYVKSVHCKDAKWAKQPGQQWGEEVPLGDGDVNMLEFLNLLKKVGYFGPLTIEREIAGEQQIMDFEKGITRLKKWKNMVWNE
ncbi:sugar phosphate isomerase/epimerase [candidate division KSB1 bacterium]|nr:sugar phosphate isomerase/epimerase [candidate division KSB1 bacterium]